MGLHVCFAAVVGVDVAAAAAAAAAVAVDERARLRRRRARASYEFVQEAGRAIFGSSSRERQ